MKVTTLIFTASIFTFLSIITWVTLSTVSVYSGVSGTAETAVNVFFNNQIGNMLPISVSTAMFVFFTVEGSLITVYLKNGSVFYNIQQRIGYIRFIKKGLLKTSIVAMILSLVTYLYEIVLISFTIHPLNIKFINKRHLSSGLGFFDNGNLSGIIIFIILSVIGWGVYASFIFAIGLFIKKTTVYLITGAAIGTMLIVLPALISNTFDKILVPLLNLFVVTTLISPGQMQLQGNGVDSTPVYSSFVLSATIYITITWLLTKLWIAKKQKVG